MESTANPSPLANLASSLWQASRQMASGLGLAATDQILSRKRCHFTTLSLKGVPRKHLVAAIRLRLQQLGVFEEIGFAYCPAGDQAHVWYWDDAQARLLFPAGRTLPWPEPLWRAPISQGIRLVACIEGYELEGRNAQGTYRTRWFAQRPDTSEQSAFCRDISLEPDTAASTSNARLGHPIKGWQIYTSLARPMPGWARMTLLVVISAGCIAAIELAQLGRINQQIQIQTQASKTLRQQSAAAISIESALQDLRPTLNAMRTYQDAPRQTHWLAELARRDIIGSVADTYLSDWTFAGDRVTATLKLGPKAKSADVLANLESSKLFSDISLIPDPPTGTLKVLLRLPSTDETLPPASEGDASIRRAAH